MSERIDNSYYSNSGTHPGMSLRDYFASLAMSGHLASMNPGFADKHVAKQLAISSYIVADAMLSARAALRSAPLRDRGPSMKERRLTERQWRDLDDLRKHWDAFCDGDRADVPTDFTDRMEAAGYARIRSVCPADICDDPFAAERGIEKGGMLWELTAKGRSALSTEAQLTACPVCGSQPIVDECGPPFNAGLGWYAQCYSTHPSEHCIGGIGPTRSAAIVDWHRQAAKYIGAQP